MSGIRLIVKSKMDNKKNINALLLNAVWGHKNRTCDAHNALDTN